MKKQTAVEFIHNIAKRREPDQFDWKQAKEMEKLQIIDAYKFGLSDEYVIGSEQYYNETYGSKGSDETKTNNMKTFGLFLILWLVSILISFNVWKNATIEEMLKMVLSTQIAYIIYRLTKEEQLKKD